MIPSSTSQGSGGSNQGTGNNDLLAGVLIYNGYGKNKFLLYVFDNRHYHKYPLQKILAIKQGFFILKVNAVHRIGYVTLRI